MNYRVTRDGWYVLVIVILLAVTGQVLYTYHLVPKQQLDIAIVYSQTGKPHNEIVNVIREADRFVYFAVYTFTRDDIKDALLAAHAKGLEVRGLTDGNQTSRTEKQNQVITELRNAGIPVTAQDHSGIMHLKAVVTDKAYASGSYNWTASASSVNDEVLEVSHNPDIRQKYEDLLRDLFKRYPLSSYK